MKPNLKRTLPILITFLLIVSIPLSGCRLISSVADQLLNGPRETEEATRKPRKTKDAETPAPTKTPRATGSVSQDGLIPLDEIFAATEYTSPSVSADGKMVLYRHIDPNGGDDIISRNMETGKETVVPFPPGVNGIPYFEWAGDSKHVLFMIDNSGDENYSLYSVNVEDGTAQTLYSKGGATAYIVALDSSDQEGLFFQANGNNPQVFDLYWCDIVSGETKLVMENPGYISSWYLDHDNNCRIILINDEDGGETLYYRQSAGTGTSFVSSEWKELIHWDYEDTDTSGFMGYSVDGKRIQYLDSTGRNTAAVMNMDLATGQVTLVDSDPNYDASSTWHDLKKDRVTAVRYTRERSEWKALEEDIGRQLDYVASLSDGDFGFMSTSKDDHYWLVYFDSDTQGRSYYYVDSWELKSTYLFHDTPMLKQYDFSPMEPISYKSSDGLEIHGYATFPLGVERKNLPMVLLVHGGPQARDTWGFNSEVQWLANRGYLVIQVNFRGSTGYGKQFIAAGDHEWGGKMQQDLTDAVNWAVEKGYADESRVAIMGASYGGYAALAGASFTPDVYACAIDMFGPSSLITLVNSVPDYWKPYQQQMYRSIGNPATEEEFMKSRSPLFHADKIKIPVLIAQGGNDVRVLPQESEQMVAAMKARELDVRYLYYPNAGHGFNSTQDSNNFYSTAEEFLANHTGGKTEQ